MRLIDADKIMADIATSARSTSKDYSLLSIARYISIQPTIDAEPVKRGKWIKMSDADGYYYACSECGNELTRIESFDPQFDLFPRLKSIDKTNYCPNCGAKMDFEEVEKCTSHQ